MLTVIASTTWLDFRSYLKILNHYNIYAINRDMLKLAWKSVSPLKRQGKPYANDKVSLKNT